MIALPVTQSLSIPTLTANPALGRTLFVDALVPGRRHAVRDRLLTVSGKGVDVSLVLQGWGVRSVAVGFTAGDSGRLHDRMLTERGVRSDWVWVQGETRTNVVVVASEDQSITTFSDDTLIVSAADEAELLRRFQVNLADAQATVLGGPLPVGVGENLVFDLLDVARRRGVPVVLDAFGPQAARWLEGRPAWVKPNRQELETLTGQRVRTLADALSEAARLHERTGVRVLVSLDSAGAVAAADGRLWRIPPLSVPVVSAEGAGDAMVAGLALALALQLSSEESLRMSSAAAAAAVMQSGVGTCDPADVTLLLDRVRIEEAGVVHG